MSKQSFLNEFYPIPAHKATDTWTKAIDHSSLKWSGLLPENLDNHRCVYDGCGVIYDGRGFYRNHVLSFGNKACALCVKAEIEAELANESNECQMCPLKQLSGLACHNDGSAYAVGMSGDPKAMLELLHQAKKFVMINDIVASDRPVSTLSSPIMEFSDNLN